MLGQVKWFNAVKGFGFIEANGEDYFVHYSSIKGTGFKNLNEGDKVDFKAVKGNKGMNATEVLLCSDVC